MSEKRTITTEIPSELPIQVVSAEEMWENRGLANQYKGLCEYSETLWLGYLAYNYLNYDYTKESQSVQPALVESWSTDGQFLGIAIRKIESDHPEPKGSFGEETELLLWSPYPELTGHVVSTENGITMARELGIFPIDRDMVEDDPWKDYYDAAGWYDEVNAEMSGYVEGEDSLERQNEIRIRLIQEIMEIYEIQDFIEIYSDIYENNREKLIPPELRE